MYWPLRLDEREKGTSAQQKEAGSPLWTTIARSYEGSEKGKRKNYMKCGIKERKKGINVQAFPSANR